MEGKASIQGLDAAMKALQSAFPVDHKKQAQIINGAMGSSARKSFLPVSKQLAKHGDASGALSESLAIRAMPARLRRQRGKAGGMQMMPVRFSLKAIALYISHYYTSRGLNAPADVLSIGIRHGHLIEFGSRNNAADSFLWKATIATPRYVSLFAGELKKRIESAVKRAARKSRR